MREDSLRKKKFLNEENENINHNDTEIARTTDIINSRKDDEVEVDGDEPGS